VTAFTYAARLHQRNAAVRLIERAPRWQYRVHQNSRPFCLRSVLASTPRRACGGASARRAHDGARHRAVRRLVLGRPDGAGAERRPHREGEPVVPALTPERKAKRDVISYTAIRSAGRWRARWAPGQATTYADARAIRCAVLAQTDDLRTRCAPGQPNCHGQSLRSCSVVAGVTPGMHQLRYLDTSCVSCHTYGIVMKK
jgi:hypothetical protein